MGRYKTALRAESDAKRLGYSVDIPVPPHGLGRRMDEIADWLNVHSKGEWASHGKTVGYVHIARYYFASPWDAHAFEQWADGEGLDSQNC